jgi:hypothetical protein
MSQIFRLARLYFVPSQNGPLYLSLCLFGLLLAVTLKFSSLHPTLRSVKLSPVAATLGLSAPRLRALSPFLLVLFFL